MPSDAALSAVGATPLKAMLVRQGAEVQTIDLAAKFGAGYTFAVQSSNGASVDATVDGRGILTLAYGNLGSSDLRIVATSADGETLTDDFRVRVAGENAYTIAVIPDTQDYTSNGDITHIFGEMTQWLLDNKDSLNIQFVTHVGDVTQTNATGQWAIAEAALRKLDGKIPYSILPGNHDIASGGKAETRTLDYLSEYFPVAEQSKLPGFGGVYDKEPASFQNNYFTFTAPDGTKWLSLALEFGPRDDVLRWAGEVIESHLDSRVMITTHGYMAGDERVGPVTEQLTGENGGPSYGVGNDDRGSADGDGVWQKLASKYPNVAFTFSGHNFLDGAETRIDYGAGGQPVLQMFVNYQNGVSREITGDGDQALGSNGGNGAIRLVTVDPKNNAVYTDSYFTNLDDYLDGYRGKVALDRNGLTGPYRGHQEDFQGIDLSTPAANPFAKAGGDRVVDATAGDSASVALDGSGTIVPAGVEASYVWRNADGRVVATGVNPTVGLATGSHALTLEVTAPNGLASSDEVRVLVRGESTLLVENFNDGRAEGWAAPVVDGEPVRLGATSPLGNGLLGAGPTQASPLKVVGTVNSNEPAAEAEGTLKDLTNAGTNVLVYDGTDARRWSDYVYDVTLNTVDNSGQIGVVFGYQDAANHYRLTFDVGGNTRTLVKVQGGVETVLAIEARGLVMGADVDLRVAMANGEIHALLDGRGIFDGPVRDPAPLGRGTVGVYSQTQDAAAFDNIVVDKAVLTAQGESDARGIDVDGDGFARVALNAASSFGPEAITNYRWLLNNQEIGAGKDVILKVPVGVRNVTLEVTDAAGKISTDVVRIEAVGREALLLDENFGGGIGSGWRFINEGETSTGAPTPVQATWRIEAGKLVQDADISSRQLTSGGNASSDDLWDRGWSPLGDGDYILRKGAYALYEGGGAKGWKDYSIQMSLEGGGNDAIGLLFYYKDPNNYYKLELDNTHSLYQLTRLVDGVESLVARTGGRYALDTATQLRVDVKDSVIDVTLDGERVFANRIEDRSHDGGTFALYNWSADGGVSYDDIRVVSLANELPETDDVVGTSGGDLLSGTAAGDVILGFAGDDVLVGGDGDDLLSGGSGFDTANYADSGPALAAFRQGYTVSGNLATGGTVTGVGTAAAIGTDAVFEIEAIAFLDGTVEAGIGSATARAYRMYDAAFDRAPDAFGFNFFVDALDNGQGTIALAGGFAASAEFGAATGALSNGDFVERLYENALERSGDAAGAAFWTGELDAGRLSAAEVLAGFAESAEHIKLLRPAVEEGLFNVDATAAQVSRLYGSALDRWADADGLRFFVNALKSGASSVGGLADAFVGSSEFVTRFGTPSNGEFVAQLYANTFGRTGDAEGTTFWTEALANGRLDRGDVLLGFAESFENKVNTAPATADGILLL